MKTFKKFFSSFRNAVISIVCAVAVLAAIGTGVALAAGAGKSDAVMDRKTAFGYALADAGVSEQEVTVTKQKLEKEKGEQYYEFDFFSKEYEYSYEIDAFTGAVRGVSVEALFGKPSEGQESMAAGNGQGTSQPGAGQQDEEGSGQGTSQAGAEGSGQGSAQAGTEGSGQGAAQAGAEGSGQSLPQPGSGQQGQAGSVDLDTAKSIALTDAGVSIEDVRFTESKLDWDDGVQVYDIEFFAGGAEYDYEIDAATGVILSRDAKGVWNSQNGPVDLDTAKSTALTDAGVSAADAVFTKSKLDWDDGVQVYDIDFLAGSAEYDYEIDASTGAILEKGMKLLRDAFAAADGQGSNGSAGAGNSYIGEEQARSIAASHAGLEVTDVVFTKTKLEQHDGYVKYEVEFRKDRMEYEYEIDALTGSILKHETEYD